MHDEFTLKETLREGNVAALAATGCASHNMPTRSTMCEPV